jgi:hypothetical protein
MAGTADSPGASSTSEPIDAVRSTRFSLDRLPFIPVPEIDTAPHSGVTVGLIPVMLSNNNGGQIDQILAPDIIHSQYFGWGARWRTFRYPSDDERWSVVAGAKQFVEREFNAQYDLGLNRADRWSWSAHAMYDRSGTGRFYGLGNESPRTGETTFVNEQMRIEVTAARNFTRVLQLAYLMRTDKVKIEPGVFDSLCSIETRYPNLPGVGTAGELQQRLTLTYDTRESVVVPRRGERLVAFAGSSMRALGGKGAYSYVGFDGTWLQPASPDATLVAHIAARYMPSYANAPFWALSSIGGDRSVIAEAQPLRAFGVSRYVDRNSVSASVEARNWMRAFHLFDTDLKLELAPFVDSGKVFSSLSGGPISHLHVGGGMGFRVVALPFVVGYLDIAYGSERLAVFSGIDYPF